MLGDVVSLDCDSTLMASTGTDTTLVLTAGDVIHAVALPSLGVKADAIPGRLQLAHLTVSAPGRHYGQCSELCGAMHGYMPVSVLFFS